MSYHFGPFIPAKTRALRISRQSLSFKNTEYSDTKVNKRIKRRHEKCIIRKSLRVLVSLYRMRYERKKSYFYSNNNLSGKNYPISLKKNAFVSLY